MSETGYVYTLNDPRSGEPKYVGATNDPERRFRGHKNGSTNKGVDQWINDLDSNGHQPKMKIVKVAELDDLSEAEQKVIERLSEEWELLNGEISTPYTTANIKDKTNDTNIPVTEDARRRLRTFKSQYDESYSESIHRLIDAYESE